MLIKVFPAQDHDVRHAGLSRREMNLIVAGARLDGERGSVPGPIQWPAQHRLDDTRKSNTLKFGIIASAAITSRRMGEYFFGSDMLGISTIVGSTGLVESTFRTRTRSIGWPAEIVPVASAGNGVLPRGSFCFGSLPVRQMSISCSPCFSTLAIWMSGFERERPVVVMDRVVLLDVVDDQRVRICPAHEAGGAEGALHRIVRLAHHGPHRAGGQDPVRILRQRRVQVRERQLQIREVVDAVRSRAPSPWAPSPRRL